MSAAAGAELDLALDGKGELTCTRAEAQAEIDRIEAELVAWPVRRDRLRDERRLLLRVANYPESGGTGI
jgi:hypothetical protein